MANNKYININKNTNNNLFPCLCVYILSFPPTFILHPHNQRLPLLHGDIRSNPAPGFLRTCRFSIGLKMSEFRQQPKRRRDNASSSLELRRERNRRYYASRRASRQGTNTETGICAQPSLATRTNTASEVHANTHEAGEGYYHHYYH
jgi:hypothetical protein